MASGVAYAWPNQAIIVLAVATLGYGAQGAYFYLEEGQERCFREDILEHQVMRMAYTMHDKDILDVSKEKPSECKIAVKSPQGVVVVEQQLSHNDHEGKVVHAAREAGHHSVCMQCVAHTYFGRRKMRWTIAFDVLGDGNSLGAPDPDKVATVDNFVKSTEVGVKELISRISAIITENDYEKAFEAQFVRTSDAVNTDVSMFKLVQILLIVGVTAYQIHHMSKFLKRNRIFECCLPMAHKRPIL